MGLPKQLREQVRQGKEIEAQLRKEQEDSGEEDKSQEEIDKLLAEISPPTEEKPAAGVTELHPKPEEDLDITPEPKPERTDWKQKYSVLQGKYDAEVPRLSESLRNANTRIDGLEDRLVNAAAPTPDPEPKPRTDFTAEEVADYGEDLLEIIGRKARSIVEEEYLPRITTLTTEVGQLKVQLGETGQRVAHQETNEVFTQLDATVKDWRKVNIDPDFHIWLDQLDPFSGDTRKNLMLNAFNRRNAHQVKAFFDKYAEENAAIIPGSAAVQPSGQGGDTPTATLDLNDYIAPGSPRSGGDVGAPKDKRIWLHAEIGSFYSDVQKGHYKNRLEDKARIEADIVAATREGRIR